MKNKQRATITSINHLNKTFEVKITNNSTALKADENGYVLLSLPKGKFGEYFEIGDEIELKKHGNHDFKIINLTCDALRLAKFKRDLISISRRLDNANHPLKRCILLHKPNCVLLSFTEFEKLEKINLF